MSTTKTMSRKDLKHDEFVDSMKVATGFLFKNRRTMGICIAAIVVIIAAVFGYMSYRANQEESAAEALRQPIEYIFAPLNTELSSGMTFTFDKQKYEAALPLFEDITDQYSGTRTAAISEYYAAVCRLEMGQYEESTAILAKIQNNRGVTPLVRSIAAMKTAEAHHKRGDNDSAINILNELVADPDLAYPTPAILMQLGDIQMEAGQLEEARASFQRIKDEFGDSLFSQPGTEKIGIIDLDLAKQAAEQHDHEAADENTESP